MYKIIELNERKIEEFKHKIIFVIDSKKKDALVGRDYLGSPTYDYVWVLTCLVEVYE